MQISPPHNAQLKTLPSGKKDGRIRWTDLAAMADHLKLGTFIHRASGEYKSTLNAPFGWGVVSDHSNIWAPLGESLIFIGIEGGNNDRIKPITIEKFLGYEAIKEMFPLDRKHDGVWDVVPDEAYVKISNIRARVKDITSSD